MRKLDFAFQTVLFVFLIMLLSAGVLWDKGFFLWTLLIQFFLGIQQVLSAFITMLRQNKNEFRRRGIRIYWICVGVYFVVFGALYLAKMEDAAIVWFFTAWGIAVYYYIFTIRLAFGNEKRTFLDIVN